MPEQHLPPSFEAAVRDELASIVAAGPQPDDARLDALEAGPVPQQKRPARTLLTAAAVVLALVGAGAVVLRAGGEDQRVASGSADHPCGEDASQKTLGLTETYREEAHLLVPMSVVTADLGQGGPSGQPTIVPGEASAELRYPGGEVIRFTTAPGTAQEAAPSQFPTTRAEADAEIDERVGSITSGMTAAGDVTTVETPVPVSRGLLESVARSAIALPATMATALAAGEPFPEVQQVFELGGHSFNRTVGYTDEVAHVRTALTSAGEGGVRTDGQELAGMTGAAQPEPVLEFTSDGAYQWLVFVPSGLEVTLDASDGDQCTAVLDDVLTGGEYWLVEDGSGDQSAAMQASTKGTPTAVTLSTYGG